MKLPNQRDYPREIMIRGSIWKIKFVRRLGPKFCGECDLAEKEILIAQKLKPAIRMETFIHEVLHAFEEEYKLRLPHKLIYALEKPLCNLLIENL